MTRKLHHRLVHGLGVVLVAVTVAFGMATPATAAVSTSVRGATGSACVPGSWKIDLAQLVQATSVTGTLSTSGSIDVNFSRTHKFLESYADTITGTGPTVTVETKYSGAVSATFRTTSRNLTLTNIENATSQIQTITVSGHAAAPITKEPADGTFAAGSSVTLPYTCRNQTMTISNGAGTLHLSKTRGA